MRGGKMRAAKALLLLALLLDGATRSSRALSTCATVDVDHVKRKRVEAVRGQILSKLRLSAPPQSEGPSEVPPLVHALYNSTKELQEQLRRERQRSCGGQDGAETEYYAKEVYKFNMVFGPQESSEYKPPLLYTRAHRTLNPLDFRCAPDLSPPIRRFYWRAARNYTPG